MLIEKINLKVKYNKREDWSWGNIQIQLSMPCYVAMLAVHDLVNKKGLRTKFPLFFT